MQLDPLPSTRLNIITEHYERIKPLEATAFGLTGAWIVLNNIDKGTDAYHMSGIFAGSSLLATAWINLVSPNNYRSDLKLLNDLDDQGYAKEALAYYSIRSKARTSLWSRRTSAAIYLVSGLSSALIAGNSAGLSESERFYSNLNAIGFVLLAAYQMFTPSEVELAEEKIEKELAKPSPKPSIGTLSL